MKRILLVVLVVLSLIANAALVTQLRSRGNPAPAASSGRDTASLSNETASDPIARGALASDLSARADAPLKWTDLPVDDLPALVEVLRAQGFPPAIVRSVINTRINALQLDRRLALLKSIGPREYWKNTLTSPTSNPEYRAAQREMAQERTRLLAELLGDSPQQSENALTSMRNRYGNLPAEKIEQVQLIATDYNELMSEVRRESQGMLLAEDREKLAYLEREQRADLQALLDPAEYDEYMLRASNTANAMRQSLVGMEPNEQEFRQIFALQLTFDDAYGTNMRRNTPEWQAERRAAEQQLIAAVKASLGEERGVEFERSRDPSYAQAMQLTQRMQLSKEAAHQTWEIQRSVQQQYVALQSDRALTPEQRNARLAAVIGEARTTLTSVLGDDTAEAYQQQSAGSWLRSLEQRANTPPRPAPAPAAR